jgi:hypothetical protein
MESQMGELEQIAIAKAQVLGFNWAEVKPFPDSVNDSKSEPVADFRVNDGIVTILISPDSEVMDRNIREAFAENLLCACRNVEDGLYEMGMPVTGNPAVDVLVAEVCCAYSSYFTASRQIQKFGKEGIRKFHRYQLNERMELVDNEVKGSVGERDKQHVAIFSLLGCQMTADMLEERLPIVPGVVGDIVEPLPWVFENINGSKLEWGDKLKILYAVTLEIAQGLLVPESYLLGNLLQQDRGDNVTSLELAGRGVLKGNVFYKAVEIEKYMTSTYLGKIRTGQANDGPAS